MSSVDIIANPYKQDFPLLTSMPDLAFLDSAATAQRPTCVIDALPYFYKNMNANPLRGLYELSIEATEAIEKARQHVADFIGASDKREISFNRNASEALNVIAQAFAPTVLNEDDEVCITIMEHHSNLIPWQQVCKKTGAKLIYMYCDENGLLSDEELSKIGPKTKIVSAVHVSNVLGVTNPIRRMADLVHAQGGYMVVDGAQSVPHMRVDIKELDCDFFVFSAHKVFGPFGTGCLWGKYDILAAMPPLLTGGEMIAKVTQQDAVWSDPPEKFEAGTQDAAGIYATDVALDYFDTLDLADIEARELALMEYLSEGMNSLGFIEVVGPSDPTKRLGAYSFNVRNVHPHDVSGILSGENIAIRAGHHCAQPLLRYLGMHTCCRASIAFYNDAKDIDRLIEGLELVGRMFNVE